jgi:hypothetical protein
MAAWRADFPVLVALRVVPAEAGFWLAGVGSRIAKLPALAVRVVPALVFLENALVVHWFARFHHVSAVAVNIAIAGLQHALLFCSVAALPRLAVLVRCAAASSSAAGNENQPRNQYYRKQKIHPCHNDHLVILPVPVVFSPAKILKGGCFSPSQSCCLAGSSRAKVYINIYIYFFPLDTMALKFDPTRALGAGASQQPQRLLSPPKLLQDASPQLSFAERTRQAVKELTPALKKYLRLLNNNPSFDRHSDSAMLTISSCGECAGVLRLLLASRGLEFDEYIRMDHQPHTLLISKTEPIVMVDANYLVFFLWRFHSHPEYLPAEEILVIEANNFHDVGKTFHSLKKKFLEEQLRHCPGSEITQKAIEKFEESGKTESNLFSYIWDAEDYSLSAAGLSEVLRLYSRYGTMPAHYAPLVDALKRDGIL